MRAGQARVNWFCVLHLLALPVQSGTTTCGARAPARAGAGAWLGAPAMGAGQYQWAKAAQVVLSYGSGSSRKA